MFNDWKESKIFKNLKKKGLFTYLKEDRGKPKNHKGHHN